MGKESTLKQLLIGHALPTVLEESEANQQASDLVRFFELLIEADKEISTNKNLRSLP